MRILFLLFSLLFVLNSNAVEKGQFLGSKAIESVPDWFKTTFLDLSDDIAEASENNRHVMLYFHQDGCPYCAKLIKDNFHNKSLVAKLKKDFDTIETNIWGDRELTDWSGKEFSEKEFAEFMRVQFTPTLVFLNSKGDTVLRLNGYQSTTKMFKVLDYVADKKYLNQSFANYINTFNKNTDGSLNKNILFEKPPHILTRSKKFPAQEYLAVFFEQPSCPNCDNFHKNIIQLDKSKELLKQMQVVQLNALSNEKIITPAGKKTTASKWYESLNLTYKPAIVFFDKFGKEIIRKDAMFKTFHWYGIMTYVLSGKYQNQPNFQRYLENKADQIREKGVDVNIWN